MIGLASRYGRYGYRRITALLRQVGWRVNHERVARLWRWEGLKGPARQLKRGRLGLNVAREFTAEDVQASLTDQFCRHGILMHLPSDNGPEFTATKIRTWLNELGAQTL